MNCCRNSQLVVDEDDLKALEGIQKKDIVIIHSSMKMFALKPPRFNELKLFFRDSK